jgi:hypothetical protein
MDTCINAGYLLARGLRSSGFAAGYAGQALLGSNGAASQALSTVPAMPAVSGLDNILEHYTKVRCPGTT